MASREPAAKRLSVTLATADQVLTNLVRERGALVAWWWGVRKVEGSTCAWCYVCGDVIVYAALNVGMTPAAWDRIEAHRTKHWSDIKSARTRKEH
jgi:hypothetical protein